MISEIGLDFTNNTVNWTDLFTNTTAPDDL